METIKSHSNTREVKMSDNGRSNPPSIFFQGASWGCVYYISVYVAMLEKWGDALYDTKICGDSSGALIALGIKLRASPTTMRSIYNRLASRARSEGVWGRMSIYHTEALAMLLPNGDEYKALNGQLFIGITRFFQKHELISQWESQQDLINTLHASFHIPIYCTHVAPVCGKWSIDGVFSSSSSMLCDKTISVGWMCVGRTIHPPEDLTNVSFIKPLSDGDVIERETNWCHANVCTSTSNSSHRDRSVYGWMVVTLIWMFHVIVSEK